MNLLYECSPADFGTLSSVPYYGAPQWYLLSLDQSGKCTVLCYVARILISHMKVSTQIYTSQSRETLQNLHVDLSSERSPSRAKPVWHPLLRILSWCHSVALVQLGLVWWVHRAMLCYTTIQPPQQARAFPLGSCLVFYRHSQCPFVCSFGFQDVTTGLSQALALQHHRVRLT